MALIALAGIAFAMARQPEPWLLFASWIVSTLIIALTTAAFVFYSLRPTLDELRWKLDRVLGELERLRRHPGAGPTPSAFLWDDESHEASQEPRDLDGFRERSRSSGSGDSRA